MSRRINASIDPDVAGFIRFCLDRKGRSWPTLYDEMCLVAGRRLYKGLGYEDLNKRGMSLGLGNIDKVSKMVDLIDKVSAESDGEILFPEDRKPAEKDLQDAKVELHLPARRRMVKRRVLSKEKVLPAPQGQ